MSFEGYKRAVRESLWLLLGLAAPSGGGKTFSAMRLAAGISGARPFAVIDTEAGRARHYAEQFTFDVADLRPPFRPGAYLEAILAAEEAGYPAVVVDSMSHEHAGEGGVLDWHDAELDRLAGDEWQKREAMNMLAWKAPKADRKRMVNRLLQLRCHVILCFRAESKVAMVKEYDPKKKKDVTKIVPKKLLSGFEGMIPITDERFLFELTSSFLMSPENPGFPIPIKLQEQHRHLFPLDQPIDENAGRRIAEWAAGGTPRPAEPLISLAQRDQFVAAVTKRAGDLGRPAKELALLILGLHELDNSKAIPQRLWLEVMHTIETFGAESSAQADA